MELNCNYVFPNQADPTITVGDIFIAHCALAGDAVGTDVTDFSKFKVKFEEGKNYDVVVVKSLSTPQAVDFVLTSYTVGPKKIDKIVLTDGQHEMSFQAPLQFEVKSILKQEEKPEMFGPMVGLSVPIPIFYWVLLGAILFVSLSTISGVIVQSVKRKKLMKRLESLDDGSQPIQQYFANYRKLQRENAIFSARSDANDLDPGVLANAQSPADLLRIVRNVEHALQLYLARTFRIASLEQSWRLTGNQLAKLNDVIYSVNGAELTELSREFLKIESGKNKLEAKDVILISEKSRKWVEKVDQLHKAILAKDTQLIKKLRGAK